MPFGLEATAFLGACVFLAGMVDALAGGGGLITLPAYLAVGLDPALILGTNKLVSCLGTVVSTARYHRALKFSIRDFMPVIIASMIGSWLGARGALLVDPSWIRPMLLAALPVVAWLVWSKKDFGAVDEAHRLPAAERTRRGVLVAVPIGAYDGFFGPGTGTFFAIAFARWCKHDLLGATARAKILNLVSNVGALAAFMWAGRLHWKVGLSMTLLSIAGNYVGATLGVKRGAALIRPVVVLVCAGLFAKVLFDALR
ncbi:MAG: TSUP family transporter [Elusimicrobiota bacterium]|nr:MAG: TSUP family transporter [Elusimicrobiota bacterium]